MAKQNSSQGLFVSVGQREVFSFSWNSPAETLGSHVMLPASGEGLYEIGEDNTNMQRGAVESRDERLKTEIWWL